MIIFFSYGLLFVILFIVYTKISKARRKSTFPLGSKEVPIEEGIPIIETLYKIQNPMYQYLLDLVKKHGPLFRINLGMREVFVLNDFHTLRKCLRDDGENFSGRWNGRFIRMVTEDAGILSIDGEIWSRHRSFMLRALRDFGLAGTGKMDGMVQEECSKLLEALAEMTKDVSQKVDFLELVSIHTLNIISMFLMRKRFSRDDQDASFLVSFVRKILGSRNLLQMLHIFFPWWDKSRFCSWISFRLFFRPKAFERLKAMLLKEINDHGLAIEDGDDNYVPGGHGSREYIAEGEGSVGNESRDFMDLFLAQRAHLKTQTGSEESFTPNQLTRSTFEMMAAGFDSTSGTLVWSLFFLAKYTVVQEKMHSEIVEQIGTHKMVASSDRKNLPYSVAVMDEVMRMSSIAPMAVFHRTLRDSVVDGFFIPKDSFVMPNLYGCHRDPKIWERPFEFYPDHFLTSYEGKLKYRPRKELNPFGMGKRQCLGESLARAEVFIFLITIVQRFRISFSEEMTEEEFKKVILGDGAPTRYCKIKNFILEPY